MSRIYKYLLVAVLMSVGQLVFAQMRSVKGTVTDEADQPLPGTSVIVSGTQRGVITDEKGNYEITASSDESLEFDFMGYTVQKIRIGVTRSASIIFVVWRVTGQFPPVLLPHGQVVGARAPAWIW